MSASDPPAPAVHFDGRDYRTPEGARIVPERATVDEDGRPVVVFRYYGTLIFGCAPAAEVAGWQTDTPF